MVSCPLFTRSISVFTAFQVPSGVTSTPPNVMPVLASIAGPLRRVTEASLALVCSPEIEGHDRCCAAFVGIKVRVIDPLSGCVA